MGTQAPLDLGDEEASPQPARSATAVVTSGTHAAPYWAAKADETKAAFALWILGGVGVAFLVSAGGYIALILCGEGEKAGVFGSLMTGVVPTLAGTIAGYILNDKKRGA